MASVEEVPAEHAPLEWETSLEADRVWVLAEERGLTLRQAALVAGIRRVTAALETRGLHP